MSIRSLWSLHFVWLLVAASFARPAVDWSTLTSQEMETLSPSDFQSLTAAVVSTIPQEAITTMTFLQASSIQPLAIMGFRPAQIANFASSGSNSMCAQMSANFVSNLLNGGLAGLTPQCASIMSDAAIGGITNYQIQNITLNTFKNIRNLAALNPTALAGATFQQLKAIPSWPSMPSSLISAAFSSRFGADLANSVTAEQMAFDPDNLTHVDNIVHTKEMIPDHGLGWDTLSNSYASQNPQIWNWLHVATITSRLADNFWTVKNNVIPTQSWAGLQPSQSLEVELLNSFAMGALHSLMHDTFAFHSTQPASVILAFPPTAMPYFNIGVYKHLSKNSMVYFDVPHACSINPSITSLLSCAQLTGFQWTVLGQCYPAFIAAFVNEAKAKNCGISYNLTPVAGQVYYPAPWVGMDPPQSPPPSLPPISPPITFPSPIEPPGSPPTPLSAPSATNPLPSPTPSSTPSPPPKPTPAPTPTSMPTSAHINEPSHSNVPVYIQEPSNGVTSVDTKLAVGLTVGLALVIGVAIALFLLYRRNRRRGLGERQPLLINDEQDFQTQHSMVNFSLLKGEQFENAILMERLGSGGSGAEVFRCSVGGFTCAVKVMDMSLFADSSSYDEFSNEINLLIEASRRSDFVVKYLHHVQVGQQCRLFMEYCPITLATQIEIVKRDKQRFKPSQIGKICRPILLALSALHTRDAPILHRDLKAANVFAAFDRFGNVVSIKLGDFGISKLLEHGTQARTVVGTPGYIPPEVLRRSSRDAEPYSTAADIYSFGMILYELLALKAPYSEFKWDSDRCDAILGGKLPDMPTLPEEYRPWVVIFERCIAHDPSKRPTADNLLDDPLFKA